MSSVITKEDLKTKRIGVLLGGLSAEHEISMQSGEAVSAALRRKGYQVTTIEVGSGVCQELTEQRIDLVFNALHGRFGEDGCIQGLLEALQIPYSGSGVLASAVAMDKLIAKRLLTGAELPTPPWRSPADQAAALELGLPLVIKPRQEGSSVGLTVVSEPAALDAAIRKAGGPAGCIAEKFISGRELSVAVFGQGEAARCLGTVEIRPADKLYDYDAKYNRSDTEYLVPAPVPAAVLERLSQLALQVHRLFGCCGATRTDFIWDGQGDPFVLELNTLPGMTSHSLLPKIAAHAELGYDELVEQILLDASLKGGAPAEEGRGS